MWNFPFSHSVFAVYFCRYLEYAITTSPLAFNETNVIETVAASEVGRYIAKDFLINHWQAVSER